MRGTISNLKLKGGRSATLLNQRCKRYQRVSNEEILFHSRGSKGHSQYRLLSNFFGGVECNFMADRFLNEKVAQTIRSFANADVAKFRQAFSKLYPKGKPDSWIS